MIGQAGLLCAGHWPPSSRDGGETRPLVCCSLVSVHTWVSDFWWLCFSVRIMNETPSSTKNNNNINKIKKSTLLACHRMSSLSPPQPCRDCGMQVLVGDRQTKPTQSHRGRSSVHRSRRLTRSRLHSYARGVTSSGTERELHSHPSHPIGSGFCCATSDRRAQHDCSLVH